MCPWKAHFPEAPPLNFPLLGSCSSRTEVQYHESRPAPRLDAWHFAVSSQRPAAQLINTQSTGGLGLFHHLAQQQAPRALLCSLHFLLPVRGRPLEKQLQGTPLTVTASTVGEPPGTDKHSVLDPCSTSQIHWTRLQQARSPNPIGSLPIPSTSHPNPNQPFNPRQATRTSTKTATKQDQHQHQSSLARSHQPEKPHYEAHFSFPYVQTPTLAGILIASQDPRHLSLPFIFPTTPGPLFPAWLFSPLAVFPLSGSLRCNYTFLRPLRRGRSNIELQDVHIAVFYGLVLDSHSTP